MPYVIVLSSLLSCRYVVTLSCDHEIMVWCYHAVMVPWYDGMTWYVIKLSCHHICTSVHMFGHCIIWCHHVIYLVCPRICYYHAVFSSWYGVSLTVMLQLSPVHDTLLPFTCVAAALHYTLDWVEPGLCSCQVLRWQDPTGATRTKPSTPWSVSSCTVAWAVACTVAWAVACIVARTLNNCPVKFIDRLEWLVVSHHAL